MKRIFSRLLPCVAALALSMASTSALAAGSVEVAYVVGGGSGTSHSNLWRVIDLGTGELVPVATFDADAHAITVASDGKLWVSSTRYDGNPYIYRLNPVTGKIEYSIQTNTGGALNDLTIIGSTLYGWDRINNRWNTIDTATGTRTAAASAITNYVAISVDTDGSTLVGVSDANHYVIDASTGAATTTTPLAAYPDFMYEQVRGGAIAADGKFYFVEGHNSKFLLSLDRDTDEVTLVGGLPSTAQGLGIARLADSDDDGIPDVFESAWGLATNVDDAGDDEDGDGLTNLEEFLAGTSAIVADTDNDGLNDGDEIAAGTDPFNANSDADGLNDGTEILLGQDPLDGIPGSSILFTDDDFYDYHSIASARDSDGNYHVVITMYDDTEAMNVPFYAMLDADGNILIAPSKIATALQVYDEFAGVQVLPKPNGTVAIVARTDRYVSYMLIDPAADDQNGDGVDIGTNTDFVLRDPEELLQDSGASDIYAYHPLAFLSGNTLYLLWADNNSSENVNLTSFAADGSNTTETEIFADSTWGDYRNDFSAYLDDDEVVHVVMTSDNVTDENELYYFAIDLLGDVLIPPVLLTSDDSAPAKRPEIAALGDDRYLVAWADKSYRHPDDPSYSGGDLMSLVLNLDGVDMSGGQVSAGEIVETPATLLTGYQPGWYFDMNADDENGGARILYGYSKGGSYSYSYQTSVGLIHVDSLGHADAPVTLSDMVNFGDRYHFSGKLAGDAMVYANTDMEIVFAKVSGSAAASTTSALNPALSKGHFIYLEDVPNADLSAAQSAALPASYEFDDGFVQFAIGGIDAGDTVNVTLSMSSVPNGAVYYKWDGAAWSEFPFVDIGNNDIRITLTDGGAGDMDGVANGVIVDPSGLGSPTFPVGDAVGVKGGGGGCMIGGKGPFDPTLPLLALLAAGYLVRRRFTVSQ